MHINRNIYFFELLNITFMIKIAVCLVLSEIYLFKYSFNRLVDVHSILYKMLFIKVNSKKKDVIH